jgi:hypothetical protein
MVNIEVTPRQDSNSSERLELACEPRDGQFFLSLERERQKLAKKTIRPSSDLDGPTTRD